VLQTGTATTYDSLQKLAYTYDVVGNVMTITDYKAGGTQIQAFTYDALDRLKTAQASGGTGGTYTSKTYSYNQIGNLTNNGNGTLTYGTQSAAPTCPDGALTKPHAVVSGNGNTYCYDANGNQVKRILGASTLTLTYDAENRLTTVSGAASASFVYDGDGNRVKSVVNGVTTYHIGNHFEWRSSTSNMGRYYYADGQRIAMRYGSTVYYLLGDHLGSTTLTVTGSGAKYAEQRYHPWGDTRYTYWKTPTAYQFTGQYHDTDLGLYFYNARYYDSALGRFIQADSIIPDPANPQSLNRYSYTLGNPLRYTDPSGHRECEGFCDPNERGDLTTPSNPYVDLQPEINTVFGEIVDFVVEPLLALDLPRLEVLAWGDSRYLLHVSSWAYDFEIEFGQSLNGRLGSGMTPLLKGDKIRVYYPNNQSWIAVGPNEIAYSPSVMPLPSRITKRGASVSGEIRGITAVRLKSGVVQASSTVEWTSIFQIPGGQTRETKYIRAASNTYFRRYAAAVVDLAGVFISREVLMPLFQQPVKPMQQPSLP